MTSSARKRQLRGSAALWLGALLFFVLAHSAAAPCGRIGVGSWFDGFSNGAVYVRQPGGSGTLNLNFTVAGCAWTIGSNQPFVTFSPASGTSSVGPLSI